MLHKIVIRDLEGQFSAYMSETPIVGDKVVYPPDVKRTWVDGDGQRTATIVRRTWRPSEWRHDGHVTWDCVIDVDR